MPSDQTISITSEQAQSGISQELRNNIYSALLSEGGIRKIESTLEERLRASGWKDELRRYVTDLFRSGQATSAEEAYKLAMQQIKEQKHSASSESNSNGTNGTNGVANGHGDDVGEYELKIPDETAREGARAVMKELEKVCDITVHDDDNGAEVDSVAEASGSEEDDTAPGSTSEATHARPAPPSAEKCYPCRRYGRACVFSDPKGNLFIKKESHIAATAIREDCPVGLLRSKRSRFWTEDVPAVSSNAELEPNVTRFHAGNAWMQMSSVAQLSIANLNKGR